jgi:isoleucyl-tRNA synthetase
VIESYGADALRAYLINSAVVRGEPMKFGKNKRGPDRRVRQGHGPHRDLPLWNAFNFLVTYARADGWAPSAADLVGAGAGEPAGPLDHVAGRRVLGRS